MAIIFGSSYRDNLSRVHARSLPNQQRSSTLAPEPASTSLIGTKPRKDFVSILAELEKTPAKKLKDDQKKSTTGESSSSAVLSNMGSQSTSLQSLEVKTPLSFIPFKGKEPLQLPLTFDGKENQTGVKTSATSVKVPSPPTPLLPGLPPEKAITPLLLQNQEASLASSTPQIKSISRLPSTEKNDQIKTGTNYKREEIKNIIAAAGRLHGIDPNLPLAIAEAESALKTHAVSKDGHQSKGIFQLLDSTAKDMLEHLDVKEQYNPFDPSINAHLGVGYLRRLLDIFSSETTLSRKTKTIVAKSAADLEKLAVAAFNAGEGTVARAQAKAKAKGKDPSDFSVVSDFLPESTRTYVTRVTKLRDTFNPNPDLEEIV